MAEVYLISDTRERLVHGFIKTAFDGAGVRHTVSQINTGDYMICQRAPGEAPEILAVVERKTLKDFAASLRDGRYENRNKMLDMRDRTGCQLYFFVEGPAFPKPTWKVSRMPYSTILSAMTNMMVRDGIHMVLTENEMHTAQRLLEFATAFGKTDVPYKFPHNADAVGRAGGAKPAHGDDLVCVPAGVLGLVEKDDALLATEIWGRLSGISLATAKGFTSQFSVADLVGGEVSAETLAALRTPTGRALVKKGAASLRALAAGSPKEEAKVLSGVPGVSPAMASQILDGPGALSRLLQGGERAAAGLAIRQKGREVKLGAARAARIFRLLSYTDARGAATGAAAGAAEPAARAAATRTAAAATEPAAPPLDDSDVDDILGVSDSDGEPEPALDDDELDALLGL